MSEPDVVDRLNQALRGRYRIEREIGQGGMASVYLAEDVRHGRQVAVKVLKPDLTAKVGAARFLTEIKTTARLQHPHVLPLFDSGEEDGFLFYVMPFLHGESLRDRLEREGPLPVDEAVRIAGLVASALQHAHDHGIVHRDVKPANVMLSDGLPVVADFGIALAVKHAGDPRLTSSGTWLGTPRYMSPEQATGDGPIDARSDVYSLACVLYEMLAGEPPHTAKTVQAMVAKRLTVPPVPVRTLRATVPERIEAVLVRALQVAPADRHETADAFRRALVSDAAQVTGERIVGAAPVPPAAAPFVGRAREQAELFTSFDAVAGGRGGFVLLGGEPGVGKTRLAEFVMEEARRRGWMCVVGRAYELEGTPPFTPFIEQLEYTQRVVDPELFRTVLGDAAPEIARVMPALRRQFDDIDASIELPSDQVRHYLFHRYREFVERASQVAPLIALFDDLHWADEGTLLLLEHLVHHLHDIPMLAIGTYREAELDIRRPFASSLERLVRQHNVQRISLKRLSRAEVGDLLGALGASGPPEALVETVYQGTEGNPFFVQEVFRHLSEEGRLFTAEGAWRDDLAPDELDVPESVRLVVGRRLERIGDVGQELLTMASVIGPRFALAVLEAAVDTDVEALLDGLEEAEAAQVIQAVGGRRDPTYRFTHELIRQTLVDSLSIPRRQRRHLKIASALREAYGARIEDHASDMAYHLYQAGAAADPDDTLHFLRVAGDQALARSGFEEALAQYERALSLEDDVPAELVPALLEAKVRALDGMGRWNEVTDIGREALEGYRSIGDTKALARLAHLVCYRLSWRARYREGAEVGRMALDALHDAPSPDRAKVRCQLGISLDLLGESGAGELIEEGLAEALEHADSGAILQAKLALNIWHYHHSRFAEADRIGEEGLELLETAADQTTRADFLWVRALTLPLLGRLADAAVAIEQARQVGRERREVAAELCALFGQMTLQAMTSGSGAETEANGKAVADRFGEAGGWAKGGLVYAGLGRLWQGDLDGAAALMGKGPDLHRESRVWSSLSGGWRFRTAAYAGDPEARTLYELVEPQIMRVGRRAFPGDGFGLHAAIEGLAVIGDLETAASLYEDALESLDTGTLGHMDGLWACTTGVAAACAGRWEEADAHFADALAQAESVPHVPGGLHARRWWAWTLQRRGRDGDGARSTELLQEAAAGYRALDMPLFERITEEMLARSRVG